MAFLSWPIAFRICSRVLLILFLSSNDENSISLDIFQKIGVDMSMQSNYIDCTL